MRQAADLIAEVFGSDLDGNGWGMIHDMRLAAWLSPFLGSLASLALFDDVVSGFVWLARGKVIGNANFQRVNYNGMRWRISNVAVAAEHRNHGIGRALVQETLREIARQGGAWAILQVKADNLGARRLYEQLGFTAVCQEGVWKLPTLPAHLPEHAAGVELRPVAPAAWRPRLELARAARADLAEWLTPLDEGAFEITLEQRLSEWLGRLSGLHTVQRWGAWEGDRLLGLVETGGGWLNGHHRLRLMVHPRARGQLEAALVARGLRSLADAPLQPIIAEHDGDHVAGVAALEAVGFRPQRVLLTMRRQVTEKDARG
jgi:ribosomal protein S18 acetylase RimI-like enzyme